MDLRRLEYFEAVCRLKNYTRAAEELHVAQPSITSAILKLEEELGLQLLQRTQHSVAITPEGELFLERASHILRDVQNTESEFRDLGSKANRTLKVALPTSLGSWMFPILFSDYMAKYPEVILKVHEMGVQRIIENILNETVELGFIVLLDQLPAFEILPFSQGQLFVIFPKEHPFSSYDVIPFELLKNENLILCEGGSYIRKKVQAECKKHGFEPNVVFTPLQVVTAFNIVASGAGISFVLSDDIAILKDNPRIIMKPLQEPIKFQTGFIWAKNRYLSKVSREFIQFMQNKKVIP